MTATELYEIVTGHQEVWGKHFVIVKRSDGYIGFYHPFSNDELDPEHVENELLGLGVKWLADTTTEFHSECHDRMYLVPARKLTVPQSSFLAAVYAAIAEVKKEVPNG